MTTAHTLSEQVEKRGAQSWVEPLIEDMGEWLLLQLGDVANLLEVILKQVTQTLRQYKLIGCSLANSFYEWRQPARTAWTLGWLGLGSVAFYVTPVWLLLKMMSLFSGLTFFALFPIASIYPDYRLLVSPVKWLFWDIPNHGKSSTAVA